jgi:hypothetical protein
MLPFTPRSRLLDHVLVSRVSQTRDNIRCVTVSMLSLRLLDHVFVSSVSQTRDKRGEHATLYTTFIVSGLTHTVHEHMI